MTAATADRNLTWKAGKYVEYGVIASDTIYAGTLVITEVGHATKGGYAGPGADVFGAKFLGVAAAQAANESGAAGAVKVKVYKEGIFRFEYGTPAVATCVGEKMYLIDDQTVGLGGATGAEFMIWVGECVGISGTSSGDDVYVRIDAAVDVFPDYDQYVLLNDAVVTRGDWVCENASAEAVAAADTANYQVLGICIETVDNAADGLSVKVIPCGLIAECTSMNFATVTYGDLCYQYGITGDRTRVGPASCTSNVDNLVGKVVRKGATTTVFVRVDCTGAL